jgi:hypothetical protein
MLSTPLGLAPDYGEAGEPIGNITLTQIAFVARSLTRWLRAREVSTASLRLGSETFKPFTF